MCGIVELYVLSFGSTGESSLPHSEMGTAYLQRFICCPSQLCLCDAEHRKTVGVSTNSKRRIAMTSNNMYTARVLVWTLTQQLFLAASEKPVLSK